MQELKIIGKVNGWLLFDARTCQVFVCYYLYGICRSDGFSHFFRIISCCIALGFWAVARASLSVLTVAETLVAIFKQSDDHFCEPVMLKRPVQLLFERLFIKLQILGRAPLFSSERKLYVLHQSFLLLLRKKLGSY